MQKFFLCMYNAVYEAKTEFVQFQMILKASIWYEHLYSTLKFLCSVP